MRDNQRLRVYRSEQDCFGTGTPTSLQSCQEYVDSITRTAWWRNRCRQTKVRVTHGARGGRAWASGTTIRTSPESRTEWVMLHELAHIMSPYHAAPHGPEFCANYVGLTRQFFGKEKADMLRHSLRKNRCKVRGAAKPKVVHARCEKCSKQFRKGTGWIGKSVVTGEFCTKRCAVEWWSARLVRA